MRFRVLGSLEVEDDGRRVVLGGPKPRALLAILLLRRGEAVPAETLIDHLYGGTPPQRAAKSVHAHVSRLRKSLGEACLRTVARGYTLDVRPGELDLDTFGELVDRGREALTAGDPARASSLLRQALALWRGPPFADFRYQDFAQAEIARLEERRLGVVEDRIDADLALGRHIDLVPELEAIVDEFPLRERPRAQLMLALYRCGRQADALEVYAEGRRALTDELGLEPSDELKTLQRAILEHDPSLGAPPRVEVSASDTPLRAASDFVGRSTELAILRDALDDALAGRGRLLLISGEPGIGKSRLADELIGHARAHGARVLVGRCWEAGGAPAFWPWVQSIRAYIRDCDTDLLQDQLGPGAADLAQLFPELHDRFPDLPAPPSIEWEGARFRLFDATTSFLKAAARAQALVIVLDDLHAGDEPSLLLVQFLARELADSGLLVVGLYRDVDPTVREPLARTLAELTRESATRRLPLTGLHTSEVADYVERTTDVTPSNELTAAIHHETNGNPLFVGEIVRLLATEGELETADAQLSIPQGVREVIERRVLHVGEDAADLLTLASVLGREFELDALARFSDTSEEDVLSLLDEAIAERLVGEVPGARDRLRFAHDLIRDTLYDGLTLARRVQLHRQAGEALEGLYSEDPEPHLAELAHHFAEAAPAGDVDRAVDYARRAGDRAVTLLAFEEAVRLYRLALELGGARHSDRCELLLALGDAEARAGDTPAAKDTFRRAAELAERLGRADQLARAALGYGGRISWEVFRDDEHLAHLLERALAALSDDDSTLRVRLLARLAGGPLRDSTADAPRRRSLGLQALEMARRIGEPSTLAYALAGYSSSHLSPDSTRERVELMKELIQVALEAGDRELAVEGYVEHLDASIELGDLTAAYADLEALTVLAEDLRQPAQRWLVAVHRPLLALLEGRFEEAETLIADASFIGERTQSWSAAVNCRLQLYVLRREQGRVAEVEQLVLRAATDYHTYPIWRCVRANLLAELGSTDAARAELEALAPDGFSGIPFDEEWDVSLCLLAETAARVGDNKRAATLYELLLPYADRVAVSYPEISLGPVSRFLGILASTCRNFGDAAHHFEDALAMSERIGARPWLAHTQADYAHMLRLRTAPGDAERADELLRAAEATATELGMQGF